MRCAMLALSVAGLMAGCATSMPPSLPPMPPTPKPEACLTSCPALPALTGDDEAAVVTWAHELIFTAGECRRQHDACREAR